MKRIFSLLLLTFTPLLWSVTVDLREPVYQDGVIHTEKGGVISGESTRIQAQRMIYTKTSDTEMVTAEGDLMLEFGDYVFVGERLEYDLKEKRGTIYHGRTGLEPWILGGEEIHLCPDGSYKLVGGYATTSENIDRSWEIRTQEALLEDKQFLSGRDVYFNFFNRTLFWLPKYHLNLDTIFDHPFRYTIRFGGSQGTRLGMTYELFSWKNLDAFLRLDYRFKRGFGGGVETTYTSDWGNQFLHTVNYVANDIRRYNRKATTRYRMMGVYDASFDCEKTIVHLTWDKLSDKQMATDYDDKGIKLETGKRTQLSVRREESNIIYNFLTRIRINSFQTVKQELPTFSGNFRPFNIGNTGIVADADFKFSYLELEYTDCQEDVSDYNSPRFEISSRFSRPFKIGSVNVTPEIGSVNIYYGNNEEKYHRWMNIGYFGTEVNTHLYKLYGNCKHLLTPYIRYQFYTNPSTPPDNHFIFDLDDGWYRLNLMQIGIDQSLYRKQWDGCILRKLYADVWTNLFIDTTKADSVVPSLYSKFSYNPNGRLRHTISSGWDFREEIVDHFNYQLEYTMNEHFALSTEYRHRSAYRWRKVDYGNYFLDFFYDVDQLRDSPLSDRRNTLLFHAFYRFHPYWALLMDSRHGWNRAHEIDYNEYQISLLGTIRSTWHVRLFYRHREDDDRFSINFSVGLKLPNQCKYEQYLPCLDF